MAPISLMWVKAFSGQVSSLNVNNFTLRLARSKKYQVHRREDFQSKFLRSILGRGTPYKRDDSDLGLPALAWTQAVGLCFVPGTYKMNVGL